MGVGGRGGALPSVSPVGRCCWSPAAARLPLTMAYFSSPWQLPISRCPDTQSHGCAFAGGWWGRGWGHWRGGGCALSPPHLAVTLPSPSPATCGSGGCTLS